MKRQLLLCLLLVATCYTGCFDTSGNIDKDATDIATMQKVITEQGYTFTVEDTTPAEFKRHGFIIPDNWGDNVTFKTPLLSQQLLLALPQSYDLRSEGRLTEIRSQGNCGSCWAFAMIGVFESTIKSNYNTSENLSEQFLVSCNENGWGCDGGFFDFGLLENGAPRESCYPYTATDATCQSGCTKYYSDLIENHYFIGNSYSVPSVEEIKNAIYNYGAVAAAVYVDSYFENYSSGVFNRNASGEPNHAIMLVGWDDEKAAWILRNSWGSSWGENGYMYIAYGSQQVGYAACYIESNGSTPLPTDAYEPNDSYQEAYGPITSGTTYAEAGIGSSDDVDWFKFNVSTAGTISVTLTHESGEDLDWYVYSDPSDTYIERGYTSNNPESGSFEVSSAGTYYLKVVGYDGSTSDYTLQATFPTGSTASDPYEPNDTSSDAYGPIESDHLYDNAEIASADDQDWFSFTLSNTGSITISVSHESGEDLDWYLYGPDSSDYVARGYTTSNPESGSYSATTTGTYYLKVVGYDGSTSKYSLDVTYPLSSSGWFNW